MSSKNPKEAQRSPDDEPEKKLDDVTRDTSELLEKLLADYELTAKDIAESVELYYDAQKLRILHSNKKRSEGDSPMKIWIDKWLHIGEKVLIRKLRKWVEGPEAPVEAKWAYSQVGIGPVIAAGLSAHIDLERAPTISSLWKFAGQAPGFDRKVKGQKLAFNSRLKVLCVRPDQLVTTRRGYIPISEVVIGDEVLTHLGRYRRVTRVFYNDYQGQLVGIRSHGSAGRVAWLTDTHPVYINRRAACEYYCNRHQKRRFKHYEHELVPPRFGTHHVAQMKQLRADGRTLEQVGALFDCSASYVSILVRDKRQLKNRVTGIGWAPAKSVVAGWQVFIPRLEVVSRDFNLELDANQCIEQDGLWYAQGRWPGVPAARARGIPKSHPLTPRLARFIGLFIAEGHTSGNHLGWSFHANETDYHEFVQSALADSFGLSWRFEKNVPNNACQITVGSKILARTFRQLFGSGAVNKRLPQRWLEARPEVLAALLRGIFEGDGCLSEGQIGIVSQQLAYWIVDALARLGVRAAITFCLSNQGRNATRKAVYKVTVHDRELFMNLIFPNAEAGRTSKIKDAGHWQTARFSLCAPYHGPVYNLEVEEDHSYVVEGYAVHNCWKLGESFVKVSGKEGATYGHLYAQRKSEEIKRNEQGLYAEIAKKELTVKKWKTDTVTRKRLEEGKLSDGHLHARAKRRAIKIFLSHYWLRGREAAGLPITDPWVFTVGGHDKDHFIPPAA